LGNVEADERVSSKWILNREGVKMWMYWDKLAQDRV
jgi:hypothetical protein